MDSIRAIRVRSSKTQSLTGAPDTFPRLLDIRARPRTNVTFTPPIFLSSFSFPRPASSPSPYRAAIRRPLYGAGVFGVSLRESSFICHFVDRLVSSSVRFARAKHPSLSRRTYVRHSFFFSLSPTLLHSSVHRSNVRLAIFLFARHEREREAGAPSATQVGASKRLLSRLNAISFRIDANDDAPRRRGRVCPPWFLAFRGVPAFVPLPRVHDNRTRAKAITRAQVRT